MFRNGGKLARAAFQSSRSVKLGYGATILAVGAAGLAAGNGAQCEPINVREESQAVAKASLSKLSGMVDRLAARVFVAPFVDHTLLAADATTDDIRRLCMEAVRFGFQAVCVNGSNVRTCKETLVSVGMDKYIKVCAVVGFPLGANTSNVKAFEAMQAIEDGASEIDMVINVGRVKSQDWDFVVRDIASVVSVCKQTGTVCKVIVETSLLTDDEKVAVAKLSALAGADFVKTSTGFSTGGATVDDVALLKKSVEQAFELVPMDPVHVPHVQIKASGGIKTVQDAEAMIVAGASRLGTSRAAKWCSSDEKPASANAY